MTYHPPTHNSIMEFSSRRTDQLTKPRRRDRLAIMAEIIRISKKGSSKTHIMFKGNLSTKQLNRYLKTLSQINFLKKLTCNGKEYYKATPKGLYFLEQQRKITKLLDEDQHIQIQIESQKKPDYKWYDQHTFRVKN
jgi:predicted transcriptional regulator